MAAPLEVSKKCSNFRIRQFKEKCHFNIAANLTLNTIVSFVILLIARTSRIACADRHTDIHETTTVTLAAHARRGLMRVSLYSLALLTIFIFSFVIAMAIIMQCNLHRSDLISRAS